MSRWDFTVEHAQHCVNDKGHFTINGYNVYASLTGDHSCDCKAFQFTKDKLLNPCKHIKEAEKKLCGWSAMYSDERQTDEQKEEMICPRCGGSTEWGRYAV